MFRDDLHVCSCFLAHLRDEVHAINEVLDLLGNDVGNVLVVLGLTLLGLGACVIDLHW